MDFGDLIPVAGILAGLGFAWIALKYRELTLTHRHAQEDAALQATEKKRLEERLAVLVRIATDRGLETAGQIDALRDRV